MCVLLSAGIPFSHEEKFCLVSPMNVSSIASEDKEVGALLAGRTLSHEEQSCSLYRPISCKLNLVEFNSGTLKAAIVNRCLQETSSGEERNVILEMRICLCF